MDKNKQTETGQPRMSWDRLLSSKRFGQEKYHDERKHARTDFQRDFDRLIFSAPFRRLQNKTQVFPLPGSIFVHNRLTHSLEVSCVGRSLGNNAAVGLSEKYGQESWFPKLQEMGSIVAAACLAHDLGNPPFGHSGEKAIATYFSEGNGKSLQQNFDEKQWNDLIHFEGNANAFRLLTHRFNGRREGGFAMTYSTLASIVKYPYTSTLAADRGKFGFFTTETADFKRIADELGMLSVSESNEIRYHRHPLVFLVEAADDICYQIMDIEDAHKLRILSTETTKELLLGYFEGKRLDSIHRTLKLVDDTNEQIAYLRSCVVGVLVEECSRVFIEQEEAFLSGQFEGPIIRHIRPLPAQAYQKCSDTAYAHIYCASDVLDIELAGNRIISILLDKLIHAVRYPTEAYSKLLLSKVPSQYQMDATSEFERVQAVLDYISGMTDVYALDLYRKLSGMSLPAL